jgi:simple sugar transport system ATP-binding protein
MSELPLTSDGQAVRPPALEMRGITNQYPGVLANDHIDLEIRPGEIHALLGENGAGKTTLMNILYGLARPDSGEILLDGQPVQIGSPSDAIRRGISMVHQHFMLVPVLSVADNILLGEEPMAGPVFMDRTAAFGRLHDLAGFFGWDLDLDAQVGTLSVGWQQRVEILKAVYRNAQILVLDEPTAVLTPQETKEIFAMLRRLTKEGYSIIFISHKLYEVLEIADRITVIRRGKVVGQRLPAETDEEDLALLMVGREVQLTVDRGTSHPGKDCLVVEGLHVRDDRGREVVHGVDLAVRSGEIFGIAGVAGNGQDELVEALIGLRRPSDGRVSLDGHDVTGHGPRELDRDLRLLVLDQPTRGLDVGSIEFIHRQAIAKRDAGTAILLVSAELDEVLELSDRVGVMYRGRLVAVMDGRTASREEVGLLMATGGHEPGETAPGAAESGAA